MVRKNKKPETYLHLCDDQDMTRHRFMFGYEKYAAVINNVTQLEDNSKMISCAGYKLLEHRGTMAAVKYVKNANYHLATFKEGVNSAIVSNKKCTKIPCAVADSSDDYNQSSYVKNRNSGK